MFCKLGRAISASYFLSSPSSASLGYFEERLPWSMYRAMVCSSQHASYSHQRVTATQISYQERNSRHFGSIQVSFSSTVPSTQVVSQLAPLGLILVEFNLAIFFQTAKLPLKASPNFPLYGVGPQCQWISTMIKHMRKKLQPGSYFLLLLGLQTRPLSIFTSKTHNHFWSTMRIVNYTYHDESIKSSV